MDKGEFVSGKKRGRIRLVRAVLLILGVLALVNVILVSFISNLYLPMAVQAAISIVIILYAVFLKKIPRMIHIIAGVLCLIPISIAAFLFIYGNTGNTDYSEDVIIVLGAGVRGETVSVHLARRLDIASEYLSGNPDAVVVVCGGLGDRAVITEAEAMERYLTASGIAPERIIREERSTSTYENLAFAKDILDGYYPDGFIAVVTTNDYHMFRAVYLASRVGIHAHRAGASTPLLSLPTNYLREMMAIVNMLIFPPWNSTITYSAQRFP